MIEKQKDHESTYVIARRYRDAQSFIVRAYYWGEDEAISDLPNFVFKPLGLEIRWYKYPMRDAYSNKDVPLDVFKAILKVCEFSLKKPREANGDG